LSLLNVGRGPFYSREPVFAPNRLAFRGKSTNQMVALVQSCAPCSTPLSLSRTTEAPACAGSRRQGLSTNHYMPAGPERRRRPRVWSSPRKVDTKLRVVLVMRPLEFLRRQPAQGGVSADAVVKHRDVLDDARLGLLTGRGRRVGNQLPLPARQQARDRRVV